jgi:hypothetical protein
MGRDSCHPRPVLGRPALGDVRFEDEIAVDIEDEVERAVFMHIVNERAPIFEVIVVDDDLADELDGHGGRLTSGAQ